MMEIYLFKKLKATISPDNLPYFLDVEILSIIEGNGCKESLIWKLRLQNVAVNILEMRGWCALKVTE